MWPREGLQVSLRGQKKESMSNKPLFVILSVFLTLTLTLGLTISSAFAQEFELQPGQGHLNLLVECLGCDGGIGTAMAINEVGETVQSNDSTDSTTGLFKFNQPVGVYAIWVTPPGEIVAFLVKQHRLREGEKRTFRITFALSREGGEMKAIDVSTRFDDLFADEPDPEPEPWERDSDDDDASPASVGEGDPFDDTTVQMDPRGLSAPTPRRGGAVQIPIYAGPVEPRYDGVATVNADQLGWTGVVSEVPAAGAFQCPAGTIPAILGTADHISTGVEGQHDLDASRAQAVAPPGWDGRFYHALGTPTVSIHKSGRRSKAVGIWCVPESQKVLTGDDVDDRVADAISAMPPVPEPEPIPDCPEAYLYDFDEDGSPDFDDGDVDGDGENTWKDCQEGRRKMFPPPAEPEIPELNDKRIIGGPMVRASFGSWGPAVYGGGFVEFRLDRPDRSERRDYFELSGGAGISPHSTATREGAENPLPLNWMQTGDPGLAFNIAGLFHMHTPSDVVKITFGVMGNFLRYTSSMHPQAFSVEGAVGLSIRPTGGRRIQFEILYTTGVLGARVRHFEEFQEFFDESPSSGEGFGGTWTPGTFVFALRL